MKRLAALLITALAMAAHAQSHRFPPIDLYTGDPTGVACSVPNGMVQSTTTGGVYTCFVGVYVNLGRSAYPGVVSDGANGLNVAGSIEAGQVVAATSPWADITHPSYGAKCDGSHDDTAAIQAAVNAMAGKGCVYIPATGNACMISATINLPSTQNICITGQGQSQSVIKASATMTDMLYKDQGFVLTRNYLGNFKLDGNLLAGTGIEVQVWRQVTAEHLAVNNTTGTPYIWGVSPPLGSGYLVGLDATDLNSDNGTIAAASRPNYCAELRNNATDGLWQGGLCSHIKIAGILSSASDTRISGFHVWGYGPNQAATATWPQFGIQVTKFGTILTNNEFDTVEVAGVDVVSGQVTISNNLFMQGDTSASFHPIQAESGADFISATGNIMEGQSVDYEPFIFKNGGTALRRSLTWSNGTWTTGDIIQNIFPTVQHSPNFPSIYTPNLNLWNGKDAAVLVTCTAGLTVDDACMENYTEYTGATTIYQAGKRANNNYAIWDAEDNTPLYQAGTSLHGGTNTFINSIGTGGIFFNDWAGASAGTGGYHFGSGGATPSEWSRLDSNGLTINGYLLLPSALLTGYHGFSGTKLQLSDGTGTSGNLPKFASDGSTTNGYPIIGSGTSVPLVVNTMGCLDGWDHLPCIVGKVSLTGQTGAIASFGAPTSILTAAAGQYRITVNSNMQVLGTAGTFQACGTFLIYAGTTDTVCDGTLTTTATLGQAGSFQTTTATHHLVASQPIGYYVQATGVTGSPQYGVDVIVERMQ